MIRIFLLLLCIISMHSQVISQDTFSITAVDSVTGEVGSAGASCIDATAISGGCVIISYIRPGFGVIHTQALYTSVNKSYGSQLMQAGFTPEQILDSLISRDATNNPSIRQYGIAALINGSPQTAAYTGVNCMDYKNHIQGTYYTIQGNILLNQGILDSMEARFLNTPGDLACRLMSAMQGANVPGADTRCLVSGNSSLSAFLRVAKPGDSHGTLSLDLNVPIGPAGFEPIDSLQALFLNAGGCRPVNTAAVEAQETPNIVFHANTSTLMMKGNMPQDQLSVFDILGKHIITQQIGIEGKMDTPHLPNGLYFWRLERKNGQTFSQKFRVE